MSDYGNYCRDIQIPELPPGFLPWWEEQEKGRRGDSRTQLPLELPLGRLPDPSPREDFEDKTGGDTLYEIVLQM